MYFSFCICICQSLIFILVQDGYCGLYSFLSDGSWRDLQLGCYNQISSTSFTWSVGFTYFYVALVVKDIFPHLTFSWSSVGMGLAFGIASVLWLGFIFNDTVIEIALTFAVSYIAYFTVSTLQIWIHLFLNLEIIFVLLILTEVESIGFVHEEIWMYWCYLKLILSCA